MKRFFSHAIWPLTISEEESLAKASSMTAESSEPDWPKNLHDPASVQHYKSTAAGVNYTNPPEAGMRRNGFYITPGFSGSKYWAVKSTIPDKSYRAGNDMGHATRSEHVADNLTNIFASKHNGLLPLSSKLYSGKTGEMIKDDHQWGADEPAYRVTPFMRGKELHEFQATSPGAATKARNKSLVWQAMIDHTDAHPGNFLVPKGKQPQGGMWMIDHGGALTHDAMGLPKAQHTYNSWGAKMLDHDILPGLFHHLFHSDDKKKRLSGQELIDQAQDIVATHDANKDRVHNAFTHHPEADKHRVIFGRRMDVLRRMIVQYENNPNALSAKIDNFFASSPESRRKGRAPTRNPNLQVGSNVNFRNMLKIKAAGRISKSSGKYYNARLSRKESRTSGMMRRSFGLEMMNPLFKILGETSRKEGMWKFRRTKVFPAVRKFPTGKFVPAYGGYEGEQHGVFGNDRSLYLHVRPSPQHVTHVDGANQRLHLGDEADRPVHPKIEYLQVKPGTANPGPEHAQQVYEELHRQGYTGDTMQFYAPTDDDGRLDKNGLNRRQRLYRPFVQGWKNFIRAKGYKQYPMAKSLSKSAAWQRTRLVAMEMMNPLFKILGSQARDQGMKHQPQVAGAFDSPKIYPTGDFRSYGFQHGHVGIFGEDRDLYLHVKPAPQHVTHVDGENTMLHLDDKESRPIHPHILYLQVKPGAANPGSEHAQQVYEALHRQGYTGDTMDFFAPTDSDGRRDKNGLNRRQRLYRPFVQGWKNFIQAKGYKQYPMAKSLTRRFWERKPQVGAAPPLEPVQDRPSLASRMLGKVKVTRRSGLEGASAIASNPKAAGKIALDMAAPGASAIASGVTTLPKVMGKTDLSALVHRIGSNPSAETWVSSGLGMVRGTTTGLLGVLVPGGSKSIASSSVTAGPGVMDGIKKLGSDPDFASGASEWWPRKKGAPHPVLQHAIRLAAAGKQITRRGLSDGLIKEEMTAPIIRSSSGTFHKIPDLIGPKVSNNDGMSVYVLPEEHQTRHLGPIVHYGNHERFGSVIQLSGHDAEAEDYKTMSEIMRPILAADKADPNVGGITNLSGHMEDLRDRQIAGTARRWEEAEPISFDGPEHAFEEFDRKHNENGVGKSIVKKGEAEKERRAKKREKEEQEKRAKKPRYRDDDMASRMAAQERMRTAQDRIRPANRSRLERSLSSVQKSAAWQRKELEKLGYHGKPKEFHETSNFNTLIPYINPDGNIAHSGRFGDHGQFEVHLRPMTEKGDEYEGSERKHPYLEWAGRKNWTSDVPQAGRQKFHSVLPHLFKEMIGHGYHGDNLHFDVLNPGTEEGHWRTNYFSDIAKKWSNHVAPRIEGYEHTQTTLPDSEKWGKSAAWQRKEGKNPKGGLNAKGRASAKREGHNLRPPVKSGDNPRRASFLARMGGSPGPEHDESGKPTRLLLALKVWGASSKADAKKKAAAMSERLKKKKLAKGRGEDARQAHSFSGASEYSERECPTGQMTETRTNGSSHIGVFGEKRHILVASSRANLRGRDQDSVYDDDRTHINWVHIEPGTKVEPHHVTEIFGALHDAGYTKPMVWNAIKDEDEQDSWTSRRDRFFRPLAAQWDKFVASKQAKMSKAEPNHNTSGPHSPRWLPATAPTLTPRQIALQQQSAQKLAEIAAIPQGTPAARDASVPKRSRTPLMPKRSQGLLSTTSDGHVSVAEASRILGIPHAAVTKHIERGTFPARYDGTKRSIDISHPHFAAVRDGLRQGKTMKTILYDLEEKPVTEEEKKDSYGEMYGYPQGKRRYRSSRTRTGTSKQARLGEYQRISPVTGKPSKSTSLGRPPLADPYALFD